MTQPRPQNIPPCRERATLTQSGMHLDPPVYQALCIRCGRVTARKNEGLPLCSGTLPGEQREGD